MEEKTEQLRDIFMDVADEESVTETQTEQRGSLVRTGPVEDRLADVVGRMRERFGFRTDLNDDELCTVVKRFYDGDDDAAIADALGVSPEAVFAARLDLHLVGDGDADLDLSALRDHLDGGASTEDAAEALGEPAARVARAERVLAAQRERRRVSHRFRTEFEEILTDADIAVQLTADVRDDGLEEAAEDIETDVDF
jgi:hypothetical protein